MMKSNSPLQYQQFEASRAEFDKSRQRRRRRKGETTEDRSSRHIEKPTTSRGGAVRNEHGEGAAAAAATMVARDCSPPLLPHEGRNGTHHHFTNCDEERMGTTTSSSSSSLDKYAHKMTQTPLAGLTTTTTTMMSVLEGSNSKCSTVTLSNNSRNLNLTQQNTTVEPSTMATHTDISATTMNNKKGGVFSTISKLALLSRDSSSSGNTSVADGILLSDIFPTLYNTASSDSSVTNQREGTHSTTRSRRRCTKTMNTYMMYNQEHFEAYEQAMAAVLEENGTIKIMSKFEKTKGGKDTVRAVQGWLLNDHRVVDAQVLRERWKKVEGVWTDEKWMTGYTTLESNELSSTDEEEEEKKTDAQDSTFTLELGLQREVFLSKLLSSLKERGWSSEHHHHIASDIDELPPLRLDDVNEKEKEEFEVDPVKFYELTQYIMGALARYCARRARSSPMVVTWYKIKECGIHLPQDIMATMLYVCGTMGMADSIGSSSGIGSTYSSSYYYSANDPKDERNVCDDDVEERFLVPKEVATYHDLSSKPTEASISLRIKSLVSNGDASGAENLLEAFKKLIEADKSSTGELVRLRTYLPILKKYCEIGQLGSALSLFKRMQTTPGVILEPETYILLLASMAEHRYFCHDSQPIEEAQDLGYTHTHGPGLFDELATEMAADVLEISSASARRMYNSLAVGFQNGHLDDNSVVSTLKEAHPLLSMSPTRQAAGSNELVVSRISLDRSTGICPVTNAQQRLIVLEPNQRTQLHDDLLNLSTEQFAKFAGRKVYDSPTRAREQLQLFSDWLDERQGEPFTAIVDGANVGYYMQSFDKGRFNYHQIKFMVDTLEGRGETPLVVIPNNYVRQKFYSTKGEHQKLDQTEMEIMQTLTNSGKLYIVPPRCLDDFYWMLASVSDQNSSRNGRDISIPNDDPYGRYPGARPMLITNDHMRDHRLELLEPRLFRRWYGCHIVNYNFTAFVFGVSVSGNEVGFSQADFFSREIQGNPCPLDNYTEDGKDKCWGGTAWHFPVSDWDLDERFVVRIPVKKN